ncbi:MAG: SIR2 family protein [Magnetospiraceae bacterium]
MTGFDDLLAGVSAGTIIPYLGPGVLADVTEVGGDAPIPANSDDLILAINGGKPMAPRLMYEFPRAAMDLELKKGRNFLSRTLNEIFGERQWTRARVHDWLAAVKPPYVIDINRDTQLIDSYSETPHTLVRGIARVGGTDYRFLIHAYDGSSYTEIDQEAVDPRLPILFKPMGSPTPTPNYIASDADYVDYITELMGGFAIPTFMKDYRLEKQYLFLGMRFTRDTERMVMSDIIYGANAPAGYALIPDPTPKELRYCAHKGIEVIRGDYGNLLSTVRAAS